MLFNAQVYPFTQRPFCYSPPALQVVPGVTESLKVMTRDATRRIAQYAFEYAFLNNRAKVRVPTPLRFCVWRVYSVDVHCLILANHATSLKLFGFFFFRR